MRLQTQLNVGPNVHVDGLQPVAGEIMTSIGPYQQQIKPQATIAPSFATKLIDSASSIDTMNSFSNLNSSTLHNGQLHGIDSDDMFMQQSADRQLNGRMKEKSKSQEKCKCSIKIDELENKLRVERGNSRQQVVNMEREKDM